MSDGRGLSMRDLLARGERSFSFEFFPPKDEAGEEQLWQAITDLEPYGPTFVSVTYGAGGTTRDRTVAITERIARETSMLPVAHLTCVGHTVDELTTILDDLSRAGVHHVMALRGDPPSGPGSAWTPTEGGLTYANELVALEGRKAVAVACRVVIGEEAAAGRRQEHAGPLGPVCRRHGARQFDAPATPGPGERPIVCRD